MIAENITIPQNDVRKLLGAASADAALLYIYLKSGNPAETAGTELRLNETRMNCAAATLRQLGMWPEERIIHIFYGYEAAPMPPPRCDRKKYTHAASAAGRCGRSGRAS